MGTQIAGQNRPDPRAHLWHKNTVTREKKKKSVRRHEEHRRGTARVEKIQIPLDGAPRQCAFASSRGEKRPATALPRPFILGIHDSSTNGGGGNFSGNLFTTSFSFSMFLLVNINRVVGCSLFWPSSLGLFGVSSQLPAPEKNRKCS